MRIIYQLGKYTNQVAIYKRLQQCQYATDKQKKKKKNHYIFNKNWVGKLLLVLIWAYYLVTSLASHFYISLTICHMTSEVVIIIIIVSINFLKWLWISWQCLITFEIIIPWLMLYTQNFTIFFYNGWVGTFLLVII